MKSTIADMIERLVPEKLIECPACNGSTLSNPEEKDESKQLDCPHCNGSGKVKPPITDALKAMWKLANKEDVDDTTKLVLADVLQENDDLDTASVIDWCVARKRWPKKRKAHSWDKKMYWWWAPSAVSETPKKIGNGLPRPIHELVEHQHDSVQEAIEELTRGFVALREVSPRWR